MSCCNNSVVPNLGRKKKKLCARLNFFVVLERVYVTYSDQMEMPDFGALCVCAMPICVDFVSQCDGVW